MRQRSNKNGTKFEIYINIFKCDKKFLNTIIQENIMYQTLKQKKILSVLLTHYLHKNTTKKREKVYYDVIDVPACTSP